MFGLQETVSMKRRLWSRLALTSAIRCTVTILALGAAFVPIMSSVARADSAKAAQKATAEKLPVVTIVEAKLDEVVERAILAGTLVPREEVLVSAEIDGLAVTEILVEEGDMVAKGQVLARMQSDTIRALLAQNAAQIARTDAAIAQAMAQIREVDANLNDAQSSLERARRLRDGGWTSTERYEQRQTLMATWTAKRSSAEQAQALAAADKAAMLAQRAELELRLARTEIKAPASGLVAKRFARLGAVAVATTGPLFRLIADGAIELEAEVPDMTLPRLSIGGHVSVQPAGFDRGIKGTIRLITPQIDKVTRLGTVRIAVERNERLAVGAFAKATVELERRRGLILPQSAISFGSDGAQVKVVDQGRIQARPVEVGLAGADRIEIKSGLKAGEKVVARAGVFLREGDRITVATQ
jgi:HlyD family secretion protein